MYLLGALTEIDWVLGVTTNIQTTADLSVLTVKPDGNTDFANIVSLPVVPTLTTEGLVIHYLTPDLEGLWEVTLVKGTASGYTPLSKVSLFVFSADTEVVPPGFK